MERVPGATMLGRITGNPFRAGGLLTQLAALHANLHKLPTAGWPLDDGDEPIVLRQIARFRRRIDEGRLVQLRDGLDWLERNAPAVLPETAVITHNDFHPLNVLVTDEGRLSVIDWSDAALGDRHHDIARTLTLFSFAYIAASSTVERVLLKAARGFLRSRYFNAYERAFPVDRRRLAYFEALQSWNGWLQVTELGVGDNATRATDAVRGLPPNLLAEVEVYVRRRLADAERALA
jgi:aminoglycoside phosphotransferase (APT) family kinase protein